MRNQSNSTRVYGIGDSFVSTCSGAAVEDRHRSGSFLVQCNSLIVNHLYIKKKPAMQRVSVISRTTPGPKVVPPRCKKKKEKKRWQPDAIFKDLSIILPHVAQV